MLIRLACLLAVAVDTGVVKGGVLLVVRGGIQLFLVRGIMEDGLVI